MFYTLKKNKASTLPREINPPLDFDCYYLKEDPWCVHNSIEEEIKLNIINNEFRGARFKCGLDIGCGEGHFTASLNFVENFDAVDLSDIALNRARIYYPNINFLQADIRSLDHIKNGYDFISCFEVLYYIQEESERNKILSDIKNKGKENCIFCFSVVTKKMNNSSYFSYHESLNLFKIHFNVIHSSAISLYGPNLSILKRLMRKVVRLLLKKSFIVDFDKKLVEACHVEDAYQCIFIAIKR